MVLQLKEGRFRLEYKEDFFCNEGGEITENKLPWEVVDAPSLKTFKIEVGWGSEQPDIIGRCPCSLQGGWGLDKMAFKGHFQPKLF